MRNHFKILHHHLSRRGVTYATALALIGVVLGVGGCNKRAYYEVTTVPVLFAPDWSAVDTTHAHPEGAMTLLLYDQDGNMTEHVIGTQGIVSSIFLPVSSHMRQ